MQPDESLANHALPDIPDGAHLLMTKHDNGVSALEDRMHGVQEVLKTKKHYMDCLGHGQ